MRLELLGFLEDLGQVSNDSCDRSVWFDRIVAAEVYFMLELLWLKGSRFEGVFIATHYIYIYINE